MHSSQGATNRLNTHIPGELVPLDSQAYLFNICACSGRIFCGVGWKNNETLNVNK